MFSGVFFEITGEFGKKIPAVVKLLVGIPSTKPSEVDYVQLHLIKKISCVALLMQERRVCGPTYVLVSGRKF